MAVPCPGCGREYDVTLFEFGRTIDCACGKRVGLEPRSRTLRDTEPRLIADAMLGRVAHWLRICGFDCEHDERIADADLVRRALEERRAILTRDHRLPDEWRVPDIYVVEAITPLRQLGEIIGRLGLATRVAPFRRCSRCNVVLAEARIEELGNEVPADVAARKARVRRCPRCQRVYWHGTHTRHMQRVIDQVLADVEAARRRRPD